MMYLTQGGITMGKYLDDARTLYKEALNELERWKERRTRRFCAMPPRKLGAQ